MTMVAVVDVVVVLRTSLNEQFVCSERV
jgi:hypothetical protein